MRFKCKIILIVTGLKCFYNIFVFRLPHVIITLCVCVAGSICILELHLNQRPRVRDPCVFDVIVNCTYLQADRGCVFVLHHSASQELYVGDYCKANNKGLQST